MQVRYGVSLVFFHDTNPLDPVKMKSYNRWGVVRFVVYSRQKSSQWGKSRPYQTQKLPPKTSQLHPSGVYPKAINSSSLRDAKATQNRKTMACIKVEGYVPGNKSSSCLSPHEGST